MTVAIIPGLNRSTAIAATLLLALQATALQAADGIMTSSDGDAWISIANPHPYADVLLDSDRYSGVYTVTPHAADVGQSAKLLLVARVNQSWFANDGKKWLPWNGQINELPAFATRILGASEQLPIINDQGLHSGDYAIFAGYQIGNQDPVYNQNPLQFTVKARSGDALIAFASDSDMETYLKQAMKNGVNTGSPPVIYTSAPGAVAASSSLDSRTSSTNLQEAGVDEADSIKTDGSNLYMLADCDEGACLQVYSLDSANAKAAQISSLPLDTRPEGMYLVDQGIFNQKMMVTVAGRGYPRGWMSIWGWGGGNKTELQFVNLTAPQALSSIDTFSFDGTLVASRRVGDFLYIVTRYTPEPSGFTPYPLQKSDETDNASAVDNASLNDLLPKVEDSRKESRPLVQSKNCLLPASAVDGAANPSIITITSVPLKFPDTFTSTCFLGDSETLYMTPDSLYLATTSWNYDTQDQNRETLVYSPNHTTAVHKFALADGKINYRGSAEVKGHLGWDEDKKSFRLGEHNGYLNIVTSIGETWDGTSSTRLTVLKEATGSDILKTVSTIDGIGLNGEQLYAARFLGDRAYLVTFRVADPLYVVDLGNQEQPRVAGQLKLSGYSDYLQPVSDTLLLGLGKEAVPDDNSTDEGGGRGAWYQGVKLSLFDVSDIASPKEINSVVLGKRGTDSAALWDHHALGFLPAAGNEPARLAIPVELDDTIPAWEGFDPKDPSAWYDYTNTALYSFEITRLGISKVAQLVSESRVDDSTGVKGGSVSVAAKAGLVTAGPNGILPLRFYFTDRSVLKDDAVFYVHNGKVFSSKWGESK